MPGRHIPLVWRHDPARYLPPGQPETCEYRAFMPARLADLGLMLDGAAAGAVSDAEGAIHELNLRAPGALGFFARLMLRTEALASCRLRGPRLDARRLARAESSADAGFRVGVAPRLVLATVDAMQFARNLPVADRRFTTGDIAAIHRRLMVLPPRRSAGVVRASQCWEGGNVDNPGGADFVPPPPRHVNSLLADLADAVNRDDLPPVVQAALVQAQFDTILPFEGGNGRTGRVLAQLVLRRRGLAPVFVPPVGVVLAAEREAYGEGLRAFRFGDPVEWVAAYARAAARAARLAALHLEAVGDLQAEWRRRLGAWASPRSDAAAWAVIDVLPARPVISTASALVATRRAKSAVHGAIRQLVESGVLIPLSSSKRNRQWEASGLLKLLEGLDVGVAPGVKSAGRLARRRRVAGAAVIPGPIHGFPAQVW